jgi:hypothetical protein
VRGYLTIVAVAALVAGCGTRSSERRDDARINKCADRLLSRSATSDGSKQQARSYVVETYCAPFERNGSVYADGALRIAAQKWLDNGGKCAAGSEGQPTRTVPCEQVSRHSTTQDIDCALLHSVRRTEVIAYVAELRRNADVRCDDGTPLAELGVP